MNGVAARSPPVEPPPVGDPWKQVLVGYRVHLGLAGRRPDTIEGALASLSVFHRWCEAEEVDPLRASATDLSGFAAWLYANRARATVRNRLINVRNFHRWMQERGIRADDPSREIIPPQVRPKPIKPYTEGEIRRFLEHATRPRDEALVLLYLGTGWRASEIAGLTVDCIDWVRGQLETEGKGGKSLVTGPGRRAMSALRHYLKGAGIKSGWVFPGQKKGEHLTRNSVFYAMRSLGTRAGAPGANVHRWRHTFGARFLQAGGSIGDLQFLFGHSKLETTLPYVAYGAQDRALASQARFNPADAIPERRRRNAD